MIALKTCGLNDAVQKSLQELFAKDERIEAVKLFGSRAKGSFKPGSDIDLAVIAPDLKLTDLLPLMTSIDDLMLPYKVDALLVHLIDDNALLDHINRVGIVFYAR